jgi:3-methylcrotonyl-CoA carboxylase alpha subunit
MMAASGAPVFESVLIANRDEIACRIIRTARRLGLRTIAVHSEADARSLFLDMADETHPIGPAPASESYLRIDGIIEAARRSGASCIHPGYGFLSERPDFAEACAAAGITFVGPPPVAIRAMGLKDAAKALVGKAGVPVVPGYHGERQEPEFLREQADRIGYPVLIKAVAGGGGKGMRRVDEPGEFGNALESARREAENAFGDPRVLVEKYILGPRHIEIQVFADQHGNVVHLFERDCSLQRRHQKVIEEAPAPGMTAEMRAAMGRAATDAARAVGYVGAGTIEFIVDARGGLRPDRFWFMEMNTRLQVEHSVTEAVTGLDLVELQFRVAAGEPLPFTQDEVTLDGHAIEVRLYAEDPERGFLPSTGKLWALRFPEATDLRIDTGVREGDEVTPFYDPMIAKVIAHGGTRDEALDRLTAALANTVVAGPKTNLAFLRQLCQAEPFRAGRFDTGFIDANFRPSVRPASEEAAAAGLLHLLRREGARPGTVGPWERNDGFQLLGPRRTVVRLNVDGEGREIQVGWGLAGPSIRTAADGLGSNGHFSVVETNDGVIVLDDGRQIVVRLHDPFDVDLEHMEEDGAVKAPMHGKLAAVFVKAGDTVRKGQRLAVVEAMKMEHPLLAPMDGEIAEIAAEPGAQVGEGARLFVIQAQS